MKLFCKIFLIIIIVINGMEALAVSKGYVSGGQIAVSYELPLRKNIDLYLYDAAGKKIKEFSFKKGRPGAKLGRNIIFIEKEKKAGFEADSFEIRANGAPFSKGKFQVIDSFEKLYKKPPPTT